MMQICQLRLRHTLYSNIFVSSISSRVQRECTFEVRGTRCDNSNKLLRVGELPFLFESDNNLETQNEVHGKCHFNSQWRGTVVGGGTGPRMVLQYSCQRKVNLRRNMSKIRVQSFGSGQLSTSFCVELFRHFCRYTRFLPRALDCSTTFLISVG